MTQLDLLDLLAGSPAAADPDDPDNPGECLNCCGPLDWEPTGDLERLCYACYQAIGAADTAWGRRLRRAHARWLDTANRCRHAPCST